MTTYQECIWQDKTVLVVSMLSKSGKVHAYVKRFVGRRGTVLGEAKNGMLLIRFQMTKYFRKEIAIPAGCVIEWTEVPFAQDRKQKNLQSTDKIFRI